MIALMGLRRWASTFAGGALATGMQRLNARHPWSHNDHFHGWILANLPERCRTALDVGCGRGELLAALAPYVETVIGNDIDAQMRKEATGRCAGLPNVSVVGRPWAEADGPFDVVTMIAVLHHLDAEAALGTARRVLAPGGRFLAVGLAVPCSFRDHLWDVASIVTNPIIGYIKHPWPSTPQPRHPPSPVRDPTMSFDELREVLDVVMPGATLRHHLGFRHTIAWTKP
jgi:SAM-dependent methyltransferase